MARDGGTALNGKRRLMVLGGSSGIGQAAFSRLTGKFVFDESYCYGEEDFDITSSVDLLKAMNFHQPTDVVYSVGINRLDWIKDISLEDFRRVMDVNVWGFLSLIKALDSVGYPVNVVAVTSDAAWRPMRTSAVYCASKAALEMAVRIASREYAPKGWRVNAVAPGKVDNTVMTRYVDETVPELRGWSPEQAEAYEISSSPLGRKISRWEVADVIAQVLLGPAAQTGEIIAVNGGR